MRVIWHGDSRICVDSPGPMFSPPKDLVKDGCRLFFFFFPFFPLRPVTLCSLSDYVFFFSPSVFSTPFLSCNLILRKTAPFFCCAHLFPFFVLTSHPKAAYRSCMGPLFPFPPFFSLFSFLQSLFINSIVLERFLSTPDSQDTSDFTGALPLHLDPFPGGTALRMRYAVTRSFLVAFRHGGRQLEPFSSFFCPSHVPPLSPRMSENHPFSDFPLPSKGSLFYTVPRRALIDFRPSKIFVTSHGPLIEQCFFFFMTQDPFYKRVVPVDCLNYSNVLCFPLRHQQTSFSPLCPGRDYS